MKFLFIANRFCLDLVNTIVAVDGQETDLLNDATDLSAWLDAQGLSLSEAPSKEDLNELKELRALIRRWVLLQPQSASEIEQGVSVLNKYLGQHQTIRKLVVDSGEYRINTVSQKLDAQGLIRRLAADFANLLADNQLELVKQCSGQRCILVFLDTSKSKRRRWCSMDSCGNRAKASAFYHSHKA